MLADDKRKSDQLLTANASAVTISSSVGFLFFVAVARAAKEVELDDDRAAAFESGNDDGDDDDDDDDGGAALVVTVGGEEERRRRNVDAGGALLALRHPAL